VFEGGVPVMSNMVPYIDALLGAMRSANSKARTASLEWEIQNDALNRYLAEKKITDPVQIEKIKGQNIMLKAALSTWSFWKDEAGRYAATIMAEEAAAKMKFGMTHGN
jgi:hypothetical protein